MKPRLLIVELHHLGDAVLSLPFLRGAQEEHEVHILCRPATRAIYELLSPAPTIHSWEPPWTGEPSGGIGASLRAAREKGRTLREHKFAIAVSAWADARVEILMAETAAGQRLGFPMTRNNYYASNLPWRRQRRLLGRLLEAGWASLHLGRPLLTRSLHRTTPTQPHLQCWQQIATSLGISWEDSIPWVPLPHCSPSPSDGRPVLAVHRQARLPSKQWPLPRWQELLSHPEVKERFHLLEILPPEGEKISPSRESSVSTPDLGSLVTAISSADAMLCHDSFPAHLAAALGKPVVAIFGSGEPDWFAPWKNRDRVVQKNVCPLHPCIDRCGMDRYLCLDHIKVADVIQQLKRLVP